MKNNYDYIEKAIGDIARKTFEGKVISVSLLNLYCEEVRSFINDYISENIERSYRENLIRIPPSKKSGYLNLTNGYVVSMMNWTNDNPIVFPKVDFMEETAEERLSNSQNMSLSEIANRESVRILSIGSIVNVILWISGLKILSLVAEAAVVGFGALKMVNESQSIASNERTMRIAFESKANSFINSVNSTVDDYVKQVDIISNQLLDSYIKE